VFYPQHIAKNPDKKHVDKKLLETLIQKASHAGYEYICQISEHPIQNKTSKIFHEKSGFVCVGHNQNSEKIAGICYSSEQFIALAIQDSLEHDGIHMLVEVKAA
jgi:L-amino acid N-acyltransferase YncA